MIRMRHGAASAVLGLMVLGCDPPPSEPAPGWLSLIFETPNAGDGGVMFTLSGGRIDSIESPGRRVFWDGTPSESANVILAGSLRDGPVARFYVPDVSGAGLYTVTVKEVAASGTWEQQDPTGYSMTITK